MKQVKFDIDVKVDNLKEYETLINKCKELKIVWCDGRELNENDENQQATKNIIILALKRDEFITLCITDNDYLSFDIFENYDDWKDKTENKILMTTNAFINMLEYYGE